MRPELCPRAARWPRDAACRRHPRSALARGARGRWARTARGGGRFHPRGARHGQPITESGCSDCGAGTPGPDDIARQNQHSRPPLGRQRAGGNARTALEPAPARWPAGPVGNALESGPELRRQRGGDAWHEPPRKSARPPAPRVASARIGR